MTQPIYDFASLTPKEFEYLVAAYLEDDGYEEVQIIGGAGDMGIDITCTDQDGRRVVVQCKRYRTNSNITSPDMQHFFGMIVHSGASLGIYATSSDFTRAAELLATQRDIRLINGDELAQYVATGYFEEDAINVDEMANRTLTEVVVSPSNNGDIADILRSRFRGGREAAISYALVLTTNAGIWMLYFASLRGSPWTTEMMMTFVIAGLLYSVAAVLFELWFWWKYRTELLLFAVQRYLIFIVAPIVVALVVVGIIPGLWSSIATLVVVVALFTIGAVKTGNARQVELVLQPVWAQAGVTISVLLIGFGLLSMLWSSRM